MPRTPMAGRGAERGAGLTKRKPAPMPRTPMAGRGAERGPGLTAARGSGGGGSGTAPATDPAQSPAAPAEPGGHDDPPEPISRKPAQPPAAAAEPAGHDDPPEPISRKTVQPVTAEPAGHAVPPEPAARKTVRPAAAAEPGGEASKPAPHSTSIAVWGVPSPVVVDRGFAATVGVKCSAGCPLAGRAVVVRDEAGAEAGRGRLGETPAPGTSALHAVDVALKAPAREGVHTWTAVFDGAGAGPTPRETALVPGESPARAAATPENAGPTPRETTPARSKATAGRQTPAAPEATPVRSAATAEQQTPAAPEATPARVAATAGQQAPAAPEAAATEALAGTTCSTGSETPAAPEAAHAHEAAAAAFSFRAVSPPEHRVTVTVRDRDTDALLAGAEVRVGVHRGTTGADGRAQVDARAGAGDLYVRKAGYAPHAGRVKVSGDAALQVVVARVSDADPDEEHVWM